MSEGPTAEAADLIWEGTPTWQSQLGLTLLEWIFVFASIVAGLAFSHWILLAAPIFLVALLYQWLRRKTTKYRLTTRRIEWERGILSRKIDGIDVWRVHHVEFFQSLGDRLSGVSQLHLYLQDRTEPETILVGLPADRTIYDRVAAAAQLRRGQAVGLVQ